jgi:transposase-like protein
MTISFARHQFPPAIIQHVVWLYVRLTLSYRDVEDLLAERSVDVSYETVPRWVSKFGPLFALRWLGAMARDEIAASWPLVGSRANSDSIFTTARSTGVWRQDPHR